MKHCHFSILYNELPFLKQKLPFLYKHFDQIIFYDLNIKTFKFSNDGSHEYIKDFPDPEHKITLIEQTNLSKVRRCFGVSFKEKRKMFAVGSSFVKDDIDVFWCTDMDEFFEESLIEKVEDVFNDVKYNTILVPHLVFFKNEKFVLSTEKEKGELQNFPFGRIARHKAGNVYGHCNLGARYSPACTISDEILFHFSYIGNNKMKFKCELYKNQNWYEKYYINFNPDLVIEGKVYNSPFMHPNKELGLGVKLNTYKIPEYINTNEFNTI